MDVLAANWTALKHCVMFIVDERNKPRVMFTPEEPVEMFVNVESNSETEGFEMFNDIVYCSLFDYEIYILQHQSQPECKIFFLN